MNSHQIHNAAHAEIARDLAGIGINLTDHVPLAWDDVVAEARTGSKLYRWSIAVDLIAQLVADRTLLDGHDLLQGIVDKKAAVRPISTRESRKLWRERLVLPAHREPFKAKPALRFAARLADTFAYADARRKTVGGMLRRYLLKDPEAGQLDARAAWFVVEGETLDERATRDRRTVVPSGLQRWFEEELGYQVSGHFKTGFTSDAYKALTMQRVDRINGIDFGEEVKIFTFEQFRDAEVDPCSDSARSRYERKRLLELAHQLGFPTTKIIVVRHGQTIANAHDILHGVSDSPLRGDVAAKARTCGNYLRLKEGRPAAIFSSNSPRALETAALYTTGTAVDIHTRVGLSERHLGAFEGKSRPPNLEGHAFFAQFGDDQPIPGEGESFATVRARTISAVEECVERHVGETIVIFGHAGPIRALLGSIDGVPAAIQWDLPSVRHLKPEIRFVPPGYLSRVYAQLGNKWNSQHEPVKVAA